jgi:transposase InsO family protein
MIENENRYPVEKMCKCLRVSKNSFYYWNKTKDSPKLKASKKLLMERIKYLFEESRRIYGSHRIQKMLEREGLNYTRSYVARLMKIMELQSVLKRKYVITTDSKHFYPIAENVLNRDFKSYKLGEKWVSDITYIRVNDDWNYLTTIMDLADRKIVGWTLSEDMTTENTTWLTWIEARRNRNITENFIFHSDRGVQYSCNMMTNLLTFNRKITQSMSRKGNCWDNAVAESFFKTIKYECLNHYKFTSFESLYACIDDYIKWYNTRRLHSSLGYITPLEMEVKFNQLNKTAA